MKKVLIVGLLLAALAIPVWCMAAVETAVGSMQVGGKAKVVYDYVPQSSSTGVHEYSAIYTSWAELDFTGTVGENVHYTLELMYGGPYLDGSAASNRSWFSTIGIRQAYISIVDLIPKTTIVLGTFIPPVMNYSARSFTDLDMINYPLINDGKDLLGLNPYKQGNALAYGLRPVWDFSLWQQTGAGVIIKPMDQIEFDWFVLDGAAMNTTSNDQQTYIAHWNNHLSDQTMFRDSMFANAFKLAANVSDFTFNVAYLTEPFGEDIAFDKGTLTFYHTNHLARRDLTVWSIWASYITKQIDFTADWVYMTVPDFMWSGDDHLDRHNWVSQGWQATFGYWINESIEALIRYDNVDPIVTGDRYAMTPLFGSNLWMAGFDQDTWWTLGVNYRINANAEISANYIWKLEQGRKIDLHEGKVFGRYQSQNNDEFLVQVQVWQ